MRDRERAGADNEVEDEDEAREGRVAADVRSPACHFFPVSQQLAARLSRRWKSESGSLQPDSSSLRLSTEVNLVLILDL